MTSPRCPEWLKQFHDPATVINHYTPAAATPLRHIPPQKTAGRLGTSSSPTLVQDPVPPRPGAEDH
jgi:hypothetical protein